MARRDGIVSFLNEYLAIDDIKDSSWNGLQFEGKEDIAFVSFAVDSGIEIFEKAIDANADFLITHHGHFWKSGNPSITGWQKKRIDLLHASQMSLYAAHLPLDRHPEIGNNSQILKLLGAHATSEFYLHEGKNIGWIGSLKNHSLSDIVTTLNNKLNTTCTVLDFGKKEVNTVAVCSGGGGYAGFFEALNRKVDLYITGDPVEIYQTAKDAGMNIIFAGHNATETTGVKALMPILKEKFNVETTFLDIPTGL